MKNDQALPAADASPRPCEKRKPTPNEAVALLMAQFGYVVVCLPTPQAWPFGGEAAMGCCLDNWMGARVEGKMFEITERTNWAELETTAKFLGIGNPVPESCRAGYFRAVLINQSQCEEVEVVRRKS